MNITALRLPSRSQPLKRKSKKRNREIETSFQPSTFKNFNDVIEAEYEEVFDFSNDQKNDQKHKDWKENIYFFPKFLFKGVYVSYYT